MMRKISVERSVKPRKNIAISVSLTLLVIERIKDGEKAIYRVDFGIHSKLKYNN
jgi:hypothetical protein